MHLLETDASPRATGERVAVRSDPYGKFDTAFAATANGQQ